MVVSLTFTPINQTSLSAATVSDNTYLSTSTNNTDVYNIISSIITQLQGNTTYLDTTSSSTMIYLYKLLQSLVQSLSVSSYKGSDTASVPIIKQYYDTVYAKYSTGGFTTQTTYLAAYDPTRSNMLYTLWKLISNAVLAVSTLSGTTPTVQFNTTYMTGAKATTLLQSIQQIIYIHNQLLKDMASIHAYVNQDSVMIDTDITIVNTDPYLNNSFPIIDSGIINLTSSTTAMLVGSDILTLTSIYPLTNGLTYLHNTSAILPTNSSNLANTTLTKSTKVGTNTIKVTSLTNFTVGKFVGIGGIYDGTSYGGLSVSIYEYNYITAVDTASNTITLDAPINKIHFLGTRIFVCNPIYCKPTVGATTRGYTIITYQAPSSLNGCYLDYVPNVSVNDCYNIDDLTLNGTFTIGSINTPPNKETLYVGNSNGLLLTTVLYKLVIIYSVDPLPNGVTPYLTTRINGAYSSLYCNYVYVSGLTNVPLYSFISIGTGANQVTGWINTKNATNFTIACSKNLTLQYAWPTNTIARIYQGSTTDIGATPLGTTVGNPIPQFSTGTTATICLNDIKVGDTVVQVCSTKGIFRNNFMSFDVGSDNEYNLAIQYVDYVTNTITLYTPCAKKHTKNSCIFIYEYDENGPIPVDTTLLAFTSLYQPDSTATNYTTNTLSINKIKYDAVLNDSIVIFAWYGNGTVIRQVVSVDSTVSSIYSNLTYSGAAAALSGKIPIRFLTYPKLPPPDILSGFATLSGTISSGATTLTINDASGKRRMPTSFNPAVGMMMLIDPAGDYEEAIVSALVSSITLTLESPLTKNHPADCSILFCTLPTMSASYNKINRTSLMYSTSVGDNTIYLNSVSGITEKKTFVYIYNTSKIDTDYLIVKVSGNKVTLNKKLVYAHLKNSFVQIYNYNGNTIQDNTALVSVTTFTGTAGNTYGTVVSNVNIVDNKTYMQVGTGSTFDSRKLITSIGGGSTASISPSTFTYGHSSDIALMTCDYTYPLNVILPGLTHITGTAYTANASTLSVFRIAGFVANYTYIQLEQGINVERTLVTNINGGIVTLATPFTKSYPIGTVVQTFMYPLVPTNTTLLKQSPITIASSVGTSTLTVVSASGVSPYITGVLIAGGYYGTTTERRNVISINGNTITLDSPLEYSHNINEIVQFYSTSSLVPYASFIKSDQLFSSVNDGNTILKVASVNNLVAGNTYLQLDAGSNIEKNVLIKSINSSTNTLTTTKINKCHDYLSLVSYYTVPSVPVNATTIGMSSITTAASVGSSSLLITSFSETYTGTLYAQIGTGSTMEYDIVITFASSTSITMSRPLAFAHAIDDPVQFYTYPALPSGAIYTSVTNISTPYSSGTTINVSNSTGIVAGSYIQIGSGSTMQSGIIISSVSGTSLIISAPLTYTYVAGTVVQIYQYTSTPIDTMQILSTLSSSSVSQSTSTISVLSTEGIVPKKTYIQIDSGDSFENSLLVKSVSGNVITIYSTFTKAHATGTNVQFYKFQDVPLDGTSVLNTTVSADYSSGTSLTVSSTTGIIPGKTYFLVGSSALVESNNLVTGVSGNTVTFGSSLVHTYLIGRRVVFYVYPNVPTDATQINSTHLLSAYSAGATTITVSSASGIVPDTSYLQIGSGSSLETNLLVSSVSGNTVTLSSPLTYSHPSDSIVQTYKYADLPSDTVLVGLYYTTTAVSAGYSFLQLSSVAGLVAGSTYIQIGSDGNLETELTITAINTQLKTITVSPAFTYNHSTNLYIQAYTAVPLPFGATKVGMVKLTAGTTSGNTTVSVTSVAGITAGMWITTGSKDIYERDLLITAIDTDTKTVTISTPFAYPHAVNMPLQFYKYPTLPTNGIFSSLAIVSSQINAQSSSVLVNSITGLSVGQYLYIGYGYTIETRIIAGFLSNEPRIIFNIPTNYIHATGEPIQVFTYTTPSIPTGSNAVSAASTFLSETVNVGSATVSVVSSNGISIGDRIILDVDSWVETKIVIGIAGTVLTLNTPTAIAHQRYSSVIQYSIPPPALPSTSTALPTTLVGATSTSGTNTLQVLDATNISVGTFILVDVASVAETKLVLGVNENVLTLDSNFNNVHESYNLVQIYTFPVPDLPDYANAATKVTTRILGVAEYCDNFIHLPSVTGIIAGTYYSIDVDSDNEVSLIVGVDAVNNYIFPELPLNKSHRNGSIIQFFDAVQPKGSILINHGNVYSYVTTGKTQNNGLLNGVGTDEALSDQIAQLLTSLAGSTDDLKKDTVSLLTPIKEIVDSRCLTANMTYPSLSAFIPYYFMIGANYGSQLPKLSSFDLRPYVYGIWEVLHGIVNTIVPGIISGAVTTLSTLTSQLAILFNLYDNLFLLREDLDVYVDSCGILYYHGQNYLGINGFLGIPTVLYGAGVMIGAGINSLNEAGTIYPSNKPVLAPTQQVTAVTASTTPVKAGTNKIQVPPSTGVLIGQQVVIDIGLAQEICTVIGFGSLILDPPLRKPHPAGTVVMAFDTLHNINFVIDDFNTSMRLSQEVYTEKEIVESPTSTFTAYGEVPLATIRNCFMFGTTDVDAYVLGKLQDPAYSQDVTYYVDSENWQTTTTNPIISISDFRCSPNRLNPSDFTSIQNPQLAILLSAFLCLKAFKIKDSQVLVKNHKQYADAISNTFINDVWNNLFYGILWSQDFRRKPEDTLTITDSFGVEHTYTTSPELVPDPLFPSSLYCAIDKEVPVVLGNKLMHQLAAIDLERIKSEYLTMVDGTDFMYYIPLRENDKIIFKLRTAYAIDNIYHLFNVTEETAPATIKQLNDSFNAAIVEDEDYVSFTMVLKLVSPSMA